MFSQQINNLKRKIATGDITAIGQLGDLFYQGESGEEKNIDQALVYWKMAASKGNAFYAYKAGLLGSEYGNDNNRKQCIDFLIQAAESGISGAQHSLGYLYLDGEGVEKDASKALYWMHKAAVQGDAWAMYDVGHLYIQNDNNLSPDPFRWIVCSYLHHFEQAEKEVKEWIEDDPENKPVVEGYIRYIKTNGFPEYRDYN